MSDIDVSSSGNIGVLGLLGIVFVVLKLTEVIDWSWWWVTAPFWGGFALIIVVALVVYLLGAFSKILDWLNGDR